MNKDHTVKLNRRNFMLAVPAAVVVANVAVAEEMSAQDKRNTDWRCLPLPDARVINTDIR